MKDCITPLLADLQQKSVTLVAVSKKQPIEKIKALYALGVRHFGESYLQEALPKITALKDLNITWHFIGPMQSNKTADIAKYFSWVHSVDRVKIAERLSAQRPDHLDKLSVLIQVNIDHEDTKSGVAPEEVFGLAERCVELPNLNLKGLMCIPKNLPNQTLDQQRMAFKKLKELRNNLIQQGFKHCTELSMGMSQDFQAAILEGASLIRLGAYLFGTRD